MNNIPSTHQHTRQYWAGTTNLRYETIRRIDGNCLDSVNDYPSNIRYDKNGNIIHSIWHSNNKVHRVTGPAIIYYSKDKSVYRTSYYVNNELVDTHIQSGLLTLTPTGEFTLESMFTISLLGDQPWS